MTPSRVSVVMPAYNAEATIAEELQAITAQSFGDWELIVVDDGSADGTLRLLERWAAADERIHIICQLNAGVSAARNRGIQASAAEFLLFLDADDLVHPQHLEIIIAAVDAAGADIGYCAYERTGDDGSAVRFPFPAEIKEDPFGTLGTRCPLAIHCVVVKRSLVVDNGGFDASLRCCEDWDLWSRIARAGAHFVGVDETLATYRYTAASLSTDFSQMVIDGVTVLQRSHSLDQRVHAAMKEFASGLPGDPDVTIATYIFWWVAAAAAARRTLNAEATALFPDVDLAGFGWALAECMLDAMPIGASTGRDRTASLWIEARSASLRGWKGSSGLRASRDYAVRSSINWRRSSSARRTFSARYS